MKRGIFLWGFIFTAALGTLLHFVYEWSGENPAAALFSAVNESTWEHLKLLFVPMVLFGIYQYFKYEKNNPCFIPAKLKGILSGMLFITVFYYTYRGIIGRNIDFLNIFDFFLGAAVAWYTEFKSLRKSKTCSPLCVGFSLFVLVVIGVLFSVFSFYPPDLGIFAEPTV